MSKSVVPAVRLILIVLTVLAAIIISPLVGGWDHDVLIRGCQRLDHNLGINRPAWNADGGKCGYLGVGDNTLNGLVEYCHCAVHWVTVNNRDQESLDLGVGVIDCHVERSD